ncbi:hypothetical protein LO772_15265 [Yinghuangia sp. ASG 101]|uniref:hypothetical protein n=1 Tax=Yinghuangia sp. ASG 101 TaxID=2896848 RepID=UPI001E622AA8|nr:hypothetical protein [Yinghuangia sp. ASG 101]UGQ14805.1 hypothetical protein LO772_15265 [Yinghuangia sp. ASG 101]
MDFECDRLVLQYLGEVGDVAQRKLRPADRARLVERLRTQINTERERGNANTPAGVKGILTRIGSPEAVVANESFRVPAPGSGDDDGGLRGSRTATIAAQIGFRPDASPIPSQREGAEEAAGAVAVRQIGDGLIGWPAYPIGIAPENASEWEGPDEIVGPEPVRRVPLKASLRELIAIALLVVGATVGSAVVVVIGLLVVFTSALWSPSEKQMAGFWIPGVTIAAYVTAMWLRATDNAGVDLTRSQAVQRFEDLLPTMPRIFGAAAAVYLLFRLLRAKAPAEGG